MKHEGKTRSLESAADNGFDVAAVAAEADVDVRPLAQVLLQFLLAPDALQPHQLPVVVRVPGERGSFSRLRLINTSLARLTVTEL